MICAEFYGGPFDGAERILFDLPYEFILDQFPPIETELSSAEFDELTRFHRYVLTAQTGGWGRYQYVGLCEKTTGP